MKLFYDYEEDDFESGSWAHHACCQKECIKKLQIDKKDKITGKFKKK